MKKIYSGSFLLYLSVLLFLISPLSGCSLGAKSAGPKKIDEMRTRPEYGLESREFTIKKADLVQALEASRGSSNIRIVPLVVSASQSSGTPEYRVFNVRPGNIGAILNLRNADVLIAAHGYVIQDASQFNKYLVTLPALTTGKLEILREGKPLIFNYVFEN